MWTYWLKKYKANKDGATAIEFAILALPFLALLTAIVEIAIVFFLSSTLTHAMNESARDIRTGEFQSTCGAEAEFKAMVCGNMSTLGSCNRLRIDVVSSPTGRFQPNMLPPAPVVPDPLDPNAPQILPDQYVPTGARAVVVVRAQYYFPLAFPGQWTRLSNQPGNTRLITASTAFRNEPFPDSGCP